MTIRDGPVSVRERSRYIAELKKKTQKILKEVHPEERKEVYDIVDVEIDATDDCTSASGLEEYREWLRKKSEEKTVM